MRNYRQSKKVASSAKTDNPERMVVAPKSSLAAVNNATLSFKAIEEREKVEQLKTRIYIASQYGVSLVSPFWQSIRREYLAKCDVLLSQGILDEEWTTLFERLRSDVIDIETLVDAPPEYLDRVHLKFQPDLQALVSAVRNMRPWLPRLRSKDGLQTPTGLGW